MKVFDREINAELFIKVLDYIVHTPLRLHKKWIVSGNKFLVNRRVEKKIIKKWLNVKADEKILDVACGKGYWSEIVTDELGKYFGIDINISNIMKGKIKFPKAYLIGGDAQKILFKNNSFDKIFSNSSMQQFRDDNQVLINIYNYLKPNGIVLLTMDSFNTDHINDILIKKHQKDYSSFRTYDIDIIEEKLKNAGFSLMKHKFYLKSGLSKLYFSLGINYGLNSWVLYLFPLVYPAILLMEYFTKHKHGIGLAVMAQKSK